jgi:hypothetical protein
MRGSVGWGCKEDVDARGKRGHDVEKWIDLTGMRSGG